MTRRARGDTLSTPVSGLLHRFFQDSAARHPGRNAVEIPAGTGRERRALTYAELERRSDVLAARLAPRVRPDDIVAILIERHAVEFAVAELAVLKAGAAFLGLDPALPESYARFVLEDAGAVLLLSRGPGLARAEALGFDRARIVLVEQDLHAGGAPAPARSVPGHLAYTIYTSGTTGRPKGVLVEHRAISNLVHSDLAEFRLGPEDRVAQGSSCSYDSSIEETWLAWASGATLVVLDDEAVRGGPDLVDWLRRERISVFCPPPTLLRAMGCRDPGHALPDLRLLYVGGEALTEDLADLWARGRRLENGYGPTECAVTALRARVEPGAQVTIGCAIAGNAAFVLDEDLREVRAGEVGELALAGAGLARGYRNLPELTEERFPTLPGIGRVYRTGDLVRSDERGELVYLGRSDSQVKVRGHRIELEALEARLAELPGVREAACSVQGENARRVVVGFVVASRADEPPDVERLRAELARELPAPMVPARIGLLRALPTTAGGKLDRRRLPVLELATREGVRVPPADELESRLCDAFRATLRLAEGVSVEADFFLDLGGDSLSAAELVSNLREDPATASATVRDLYETRSARALAAHLRRRRAANPGASPASPARPLRASRGTPLAATSLQAAWTLLEVLLFAFLLQLAVFDAGGWLIGRLGVTGALLLAPLLAIAAAVAWTPVAVALTVLGKRVLIGRYRPLRAPAHGSFHVRHWIVARFARRIPWETLGRTLLAGPVLRALGAQVGRRVQVHRGVDLASGGWDLLEIGDDAVLAQDAALCLVEYDDGGLTVGPVRIGARAVLGVRAGMAPDTSLGVAAVVEPLSWLASGSRVADGERWDGAPAARVGRAPPAPVVERGALPPAVHGLVLAALRAAARLALDLPLVLGLVLLLAASDFDASACAAWLDAPWFEPRLVLAVLAALVVRVPLELLFSGLLVRALSPSRPALVSRWSVAYARVWLVTELAERAGDWLSGTLLYPRWLRLAGMRVGRNCEISTLIDLVPSLVAIGDECFLADGIYLGGPVASPGTVRLARTEIGSGTFIGNHALVRSGSRLAADVLVGVSTVADAQRFERGSAWFGHPPFELARRTPTEFDRSLTHEPTLARRTTRWFWEGLRFALPVPLGVLGLLWVVLARAPLFARVFGAFGAVFATLATAILAIASVLALKWILLGRVRPGVHPLWSCWCSRWDFLYVAWGMIARGVLAELEGTLLLGGCLRAFGMRLGRNVLLGRGFAQVVDPDMLVFEDGATVSGNFQAHTFEDRVLKIGRVTVRRDASIGTQSVLFYGADVGERARVAPHGVVLKGERLAAGRDFAGVPTQPV